MRWIMKYPTRLVGFALATALCACLPAQMARATLRVVTTTSDLASLAEAVAGDDAEVSSIGIGSMDPHFLQAKPTYIMKARDADLWIRVGMELEIGWEQPVLDGARNPRIRVGTRGHLDASENVIRLEVPTQRVTRAMGDVHPQGNPHYWLDPFNARIVAKSIADRLAELDPGHADDYAANLAAFQLKLDEHMFGQALVERYTGAKLWELELDGTLLEFLEKEGARNDLGGWLAKMLPCRGKEVVTYHRLWVYFANRFGLKVAIELEPKPGIPPSPAHLAEVINLMKASGIKVILMSNLYPRKAADRVASSTGCTIVRCASSVGGEESATDYLSLIDTVVDRLSSALH